MVETYWSRLGTVSSRTPSLSNYCISPSIITASSELNRMRGLGYWGLGYWTQGDSVEPCQEFSCLRLWPSKQRESISACQKLSTLSIFWSWLISGFTEQPSSPLRLAEEGAAIVFWRPRVITLIPAMVSVWVAITSRSFEGLLSLSTKPGSDSVGINNVLYRFR